MTERRINFHAFCSVKGGVGKSTLAVATAKLLAARGRVPVVIDVDLTGTSLADGLALCAPRVPVRADGNMDLDAPPTGERLSRDETNRLRHRRRVADVDAPPPPYFNDALLYQVTEPGRDCRVDAMLWVHEHPDGVLYLPSSPLRKDVEESSMLLRGDEHFRWVRRFAWVLDALFSLRTEISDVVIDLPPNVVGFTHETLVFLDAIATGGPLPEGFPNFRACGMHTSARVSQVMTPDWNDLLPSLEHVASASVHFPALMLQPIVNKTSAEAIRDLQAKVRTRIDPVLRPLGLEIKLEGVGDVSALRELFRRGNIDGTTELTRHVGVLLREET